MTIEVKVIAKSHFIAAGFRKEITTFQLRYPRFIHSEFMTHRVLSRNASSSRAIPVPKMIEDIKRDIATPIFWGKNQSGMQAVEECNEMLHTDMGPYDRDEGWESAMEAAVEWAELFHEAGYHKQIVNRLLEPFMHINVVCTATEWSNFFGLRRHKDAQPEIHELADKMYAAKEMAHSNRLNEGDWHLPYTTESDRDFYSNENLIKMSVARCARVSYLTHENKMPNPEQDYQLYDRLVGGEPKHASPAEHQATPDYWSLANGKFSWLSPKLHGNFIGFVQFRKTLPNENITYDP